MRNVASIAKHEVIRSCKNVSVTGNGNLGILIQLSSDDWTIGIRIRTDLYTAAAIDEGLAIGVGQKLGVAAPTD